MYVKRKYGFWMTFNWSKTPFIIGGLYGLLVCLIAYVSKLDISIPWSPLAVIGIAVAFYLGFKNNSSYDRTWEARKIWGGIVNNSRTFGAAVMAFVQGKNESDIQRELIYRHLAWITALRHQLRLSREWEHIENRLNGLYSPKVCEDYNTKLEGELKQFLSENEIHDLQNKSNKATQILKIQSDRLQELRDQDLFENFRHMEFHKLVNTFYTDQGKSERLKNFPFPRQYASVALWLTVVFCFFTPFGLLEVFKVKEGWMFWICPFINALITWVFFLMEKIGDYSENPFEGTYNDVPITSISRSIEIDLREMLNEKNLPEPIKDINGFLM
jgi:putative membrane protein